MMARAATPAEFVEQAEECFVRAANAAGLHQRSFDVGGRRIEMRFAGAKLLDPMTRALAHCAARGDGPAELRVCFFDTESTGTAMAPPAWSRDQYTGSGRIAGFCDERVETSYQLGWDVFQCLDRQRKVALYWTPSWRVLPWWEVSFPLRVILHWWLRDTELQPVHAAAVGNADGGVLIAGPCGSGKSTTALSCLAICRRRLHFGAGSAGAVRSLLVRHREAGPGGAQTVPASGRQCGEPRPVGPREGHTVPV